LILRGRTMVRGPGQNLAAILSAKGLNETKTLASSSLETMRGSGSETVGQPIWVEDDSPSPGNPGCPL